MDQGIYTAAAGAIAMEDRLTVIANNLANVNTTGFKKDAVTFQDFQKRLDASGLFPGQYRATPVDVMVHRQYIDSSQGGFRDTGNPLDVAIAGEGFFSVSTPDGIRYTRAGSFTISPEGLLVTPQGYTVQGQGGDIALGNGKVSIDNNGTVMLDGNVVDVLQVVSIPEEGLEREGNALFDIKQGFVSGEAESKNLQQGYVESSNVDPIMEMVGLITTQRAYESYQKVIKSFSETYALSMRNVGSVA